MVRPTRCGIARENAQSFPIPDQPQVGLVNGRTRTCNAAETRICVGPRIYLKELDREPDEVYQRFGIKTTVGGSVRAKQLKVVSICAIRCLPKALLRVKCVSCLRTPVSPVKTPLRHKSCEREGGEKHEPVHDQNQSFEAAGLESVKVNDADHEGREGPTAIEHGFCNWV